MTIEQATNIFKPTIVGDISLTLAGQSILVYSLPGHGKTNLARLLVGRALADRRVEVFVYGEAESEADWSDFASALPHRMLDRQSLRALAEFLPARYEFFAAQGVMSATELADEPDFLPLLVVVDTADPAQQMEAIEILARRGRSTGVTLLLTTRNHRDIPPAIRDATTMRFLGRHTSPKVARWVLGEGSGGGRLGSVVDRSLNAPNSRGRWMVVGHDMTGIPQVVRAPQVSADEWRATLERAALRDNEVGL